VARVSGKADEDGQLAKLGLAIRARRNALGITQEALAQAANIERAHMSKIERGRRNVTFLNLLRISAALECPASEILQAAGL
jgi:transcriptional regulator with XRE-family HTH domain